MLNFYSIIVLLIVFTAAFSYINVRFIKLPITIGVMLISLICSLVMVFAGAYFPALSNYVKFIITSIDFEHVLMQMMLSFLLFAGAIHVDLQKLKKEATPVISFATIGVVLSTAFIGTFMYFVFNLFHLNVPLIYCYLFGALISPTDPIAVLGILKEAKIPSSLETKIAGESLFNDGVAVVIFLSLLEIATMGLKNLSFSQVSLLFLEEAGGGLIWGLVLGNIGYLLIRSIDHYQVEVLITLAIVMGGYEAASAMHVSGPLSIVVAGLIMGNKGSTRGMSERTKDYLYKFWELLDEILNALLFLLIGFEMIVISLNKTNLWVGLIAIVIVLLGRFIAVFIPTFVLSFRRSFAKNTIPILTWGGLRGGISVALALSLPAHMHREQFLTITYVIVIFSILVQGLTIGRVAKRLSRT